MTGAECHIANNHFRTFHGEGAVGFRLEDFGHDGQVTDVGPGHREYGIPTVSFHILVEDIIYGGTEAKPRDVPQFPARMYDFAGRPNDDPQIIKMAGPVGETPLGAELNVTVILLGFLSDGFSLFAWDINGNAHLLLPVPADTRSGEGKFVKNE